jgi:two-component system, OmpR family, phosphate regulon response regulator PhoB
MSKTVGDRAPVRVLVVEDERDIAALVAYHLTREGYRVRTAETGQEALESIHADRPDLVILDLMLPGRSGYEVMTELRGHAETRDVPVVVLSARRDEADRVKGLELGADDYITKPFSPRELVLRVGAVLRRAQAPAMAGASRVLRAGAITVDLGGKAVTVDGLLVEMTPTEYKLLTTLMERVGRVQSRRQLLETAWDINADIETRTVDMHIQRLRSKLGVHGDLIETARGFGYRFRPTDVEP